MQKSFLLGAREKVLKSPPPKTYGANTVWNPGVIRKANTESRVG